MVGGGMSTRSGITKKLTLDYVPRGSQTGEMAFQVGRRYVQAYGGMRLHDTWEDESRLVFLEYKKQSMGRGKANIRPRSSHL